MYIEPTRYLDANESVALKFDLLSLDQQRGRRQLVDALPAPVGRMSGADDRVWTGLGILDTENQNSAVSVCETGCGLCKQLPRLPRTLAILLKINDLSFKRIGSRARYDSFQSFGNVVW